MAVTHVIRHVIRHVTHISVNELLGVAAIMVSARLSSPYAETDTADFATSITSLIDIDADTDAAQKPHH